MSASSRNRRAAFSNMPRILRFDSFSASRSTCSLAMRAAWAASWSSSSQRFTDGMGKSCQKNPGRVHPVPASRDHCMRPGRTISAMCYSAQLQAAYMAYLKRTGAEMDIDQFVEIFGARITDSSIRIPRSVERWFDEPRTDGERRAKALIDQYREAETTK